MERANATTITTQGVPLGHISPQKCTTINFSLNLKWENTACYNWPSRNQGHNNPINWKFHPLYGRKPGPSTFAYWSPAVVSHPIQAFMSTLCTCDCSHWANLWASHNCTGRIITNLFSSPPVNLYQGSWFRKQIPLSTAVSLLVLDGHWCSTTVEDSTAFGNIWCLAAQSDWGGEL